MRSPRRRLVLLAVVLAGAVVAGQMTELPAALPTAGDVPTYTIAKAHFVRRVTAEGNLRAVKATPVVVPTIEGLWGALKLAWLAPDGSAGKAGDPVARFDRADAEKQLRDAEVDLESADARLREQQIKSAASDAEHASVATVARQRAEQARQFQAKDPVLFSRNQIIEGELDQSLAAARQAQAERERDLDRSMARSDIELLAIARQRAQVALDHARTALANLEVHAPNDGVIVLHRDDHGDITKLGARMWANEPIGEIPVPGEMEAELFVLEVDAGGLEVDLPTDVVVESRPDLTFHGKIRIVDKLAKPRQLGVPVSYISAIVTLDTTDPDVMKIGQRVRATLVTDKLDALVVPRQAVFERAGKNVIYRRGVHGWEPVTVELGPATAGRIVVTSGLAEGDVVAERDPTRSLEPAIGSSAPSPKPTKGAP
jgi:HlyD family secretion protein